MASYWRGRIIMSNKLELGLKLGGHAAKIAYHFAVPLVSSLVTGNRNTASVASHSREAEKEWDEAKKTFEELMNS